MTLKRKKRLKKKRIQKLRKKVKQREIQRKRKENSHLQAWEGKDLNQTDLKVN